MISNNQKINSIFWPLMGNYVVVKTYFFTTLNTRRKLIRSRLLDRFIIYRQNLTFIYSLSDTKFNSLDFNIGGRDLTDGSKQHKDRNQQRALRYYVMCFFESYESVYIYIYISRHCDIVPMFKLFTYLVDFILLR